MKIIRPLMYVVFLPLAIIPLFRCWFKVPYIFCNACPAKCPWGSTRRFFIPVFLGINLNRRSWCFLHCPFGKMQDLQCLLSKKRIKVPNWLKITKYIFLIYSFIIYFWSNMYFLNILPIYNFHFIFTSTIFICWKF